MKNILILGSTGSIGTQSLEIIEAFRDKLTVKGLASGKNNLALLKDQIIKFAPQIVCVPDLEAKNWLRQNLTNSSVKPEIVYDESGLKEFVSFNGADTIISAMVGISGLKPNIWAVKANKTILLANKETMVTGGGLINNLLSKHNSQIIPLDSEHSAIFQCLSGRRPDSIHKLILTGSGGPFLHKPLHEFKNISLDEALNHPKWKMGPKITIDSATLMNKGLEIIEAKWLFKVDPKQIEVIIHPESIIHSMVEFMDGSIIGQFGKTSMLGPIHYALFYDENIYPNINHYLDLTQIGQLNFQKPDLVRFPLLKLASQIACLEDSYACALNAANEVVNLAFLENRIAFLDIFKIIERTIDKHIPQRIDDLESIIAVDQISRLIANEFLTKICS